MRNFIQQMLRAGSQLIEPLTAPTQLFELCSIADSKDGWKDVTDSASFDKPTLLLCSSALAYDGKTAMQEAEQISRLLGHKDIFTNPYKIISTAYPALKRDLDVNLADMYGENALGNIVSGYNTRGNTDTLEDYFSHIVQKQLLPLVSTHEKTRLTLQEAKHRCSKLVLASYSLGGIAAEVMGNLLTEEMAKIGYSQPEIQEITKQIVHISIGNVASLEYGKAHFTGYHFMNEKDVSGAELLSSSDPIKDTLLETGTATDTHLILARHPKRASQMLIVTPFVQTKEEACELPEGSKTIIYHRRARMYGGFADKKGNLAPYFFNGTAHHYSDFIEYRLRAFGFVQPLLAQNILINTLSRSIQCDRDGFRELPDEKHLMSVPELNKEGPGIEPGKTQRAGEITQWTEHIAGMYANARDVSETSSFQERLDASFAHMPAGNQK